MSKSRATQSHPVLDAALAGQQVIEASAGTGKTWTISGLYLRLLLEQGAEVRQILAITFTIAAAAELRDRIRARIRAALDALDGRPPPDDELIPALLARLDDEDLARRRLNLALRSFDEARIHTIHGFCQRTLADHAFRSGVPFQCELLADPSEIVHEVSADWWRQRVASGQAGGELAEDRQLLVSWLRGDGASLEKLEEFALHYARRPGLELRAPEVPTDLPARLAAYRAAYEKCRKAWLKHGVAGAQVLKEAKGLNGGVYKPHIIDAVTTALSSMFQSPSPTLNYPERSDRFSAAYIESKTNKKATPPEHPLFNAVQTWLEVADATIAVLEPWWAAYRLEFLEHARVRIGEALAERNLQSFDDLLLKLHGSLTREGGGVLAATLRAACPYALVDEFQDTDPLQWGIVNEVWGQPGPGALFLVGDPKQAIYGFRGADVYAYLAAVDGVRERLPLSENQRSVPGLVQAMNTLLGSSENPFKHDAIQYTQVTASPRPKAPLVEGGDEDAAPLRIAVSPTGDKGRTLLKGVARDWAVSLTVNEIARLLAGGRAGSIRIGDKALAAGDIAVLTNTNRQATQVRSALAARGISSAEMSTLSVFESLEAEQLQRLLLAMAAPRDAGAVRAALLTDLAGLDASAVLALADDARWEQVMAEFAIHHETWARHGVMRALRGLFRARGTQARLAGFRNGERRLTNLYHLCELLNLEEQRHHGMDSLVAWFAARRDSQAADDMQLRLDSDADLVQIVTIHRSKGLEYPVTFLPFLWDFHSFTDKLPGLSLYHDDDKQLLLDARGGKDGPETAREEELGEKLRQTYVALTRAKNRCYLLAGHIKEASSSALGWLGLTPASAADINPLIQKSGGTIALFAAEPESGRAATASAAGPTLAVRKPQHLARAGFAVSSFSALARGAVVHTVAAPISTESARDHDESVPTLEPDADAPRDTNIRDSFHGGAQAGDCLHRILERLDVPGDAAEDLTASELTRAGYDPAQAAEVETWLRETLATPLLLAPGVRVALSKIPSEQLLRELDFQLAAPTFAPRKLVETVRAHGIPMPDLQAGELHGYLAGAIDLVFMHEGRWYLADYKSNRLGGADGYAEAGLSRAMAHGNYHLQYLIYTVAVHRWLRATVRDYDYDRHFGGVQYLFLRGMHPDWKDGEAPGGVFASRPTRELIEALDACFGSVAQGVAA